MLIRGQVIDSATGKGIPNASIELLDYNTIPLGIGTVADGNGNFSLNNVEVDYPNILVFSSVGYKDASADPQYLSDGAYIQIKLTSTAPATPGVTVTASAKKAFPWLIVAGIIYAIAKK